MPYRVAAVVAPDPPRAPTPEAPAKPREPPFRFAGYAFRACLLLLGVSIVNVPAEVLLAGVYTAGMLWLAAGAPTKRRPGRSLPSSPGG